MSLAAQLDAVLGGQFGTGGQSFDGGNDILFHIALAAGADVDHGDAQILSGLEGLGQALFIQRGHFHGEQLHTGLLCGGLYHGGLRLPCIQHDVIAHTLNGRELRTVITGHLDGLKGGFDIDTLEQNAVYAKFHFLFPPSDS